MSDEQRTVEPPEYLRGAKRVNLVKSEWLNGWWVGHGKDEGCQIEGEWLDWVCLAAKILADPASEGVAPNLYRPDLADAMTAEQRDRY